MAFSCLAQGAPGLRDLDMLQRVTVGLLVCFSLIVGFICASYDPIDPVSCTSTDDEKSFDEVIRKTVLVVRFNDVKTTISPRQARDKHRENTQNRDTVFLIVAVGGRRYHRDCRPRLLLRCLNGVLLGPLRWGKKRFRGAAACVAAGAVLWDGVRVPG
jgi:hypothetical protein